MEWTRIEDHIRQSIWQALRALYPITPDIGSLLKPHVWRDRRYVGESAGRVLTWKGLSANLQRVDARMRTVYVDYVPYAYGADEAVALFGKDFADCLRSAGPSIVTFVLDFPHDTIDEITRTKFVPRLIGRKLHACVIKNVDAYLAVDPSAHASQIIELLMLQRALANQRRTVTGVELRFQQLLYQSGLLAGYLLEQRLEVLSLAPPRRVGEFGHDIDAQVRIRGGTTNVRLGIEVYLQALGHHRDRIPEYVSRFGLDAVMVVAPRDPWPKLAIEFEAREMPARRIARLNDLGSTGGIEVHHLGLLHVINRLGNVAESIDAIWPTAKRSPSKIA
jgi:hypothetical protein